MRTSVQSDEYVGKVVGKGKYRIEEMIGEGGMGKVYRAKQIALDKPVVLKLLRQALLGDERTVKRFQQEAKAASRLNHPNSISVLDFGTAEDGALFIAMEFVAGKDLHHILTKEWPLPEGRVVRIISQVLSALSDAHGAGVVHRDLKPENIMVEQRRGEPDFVKVLDFGIAKILDSRNDEGPALTRAGFVCGTPEYMSPEQARGGALDHRSDLYAVGVILYQLTTGLLPFESDSAVGFATKHLTEEPPPPSRRRPDARLSQGMERLIMKALLKDPNDRPQNAEEFRVELLAVDKARRQNAAAQRRSAPVMAPATVSRKATPEDQLATRVESNDPGWGQDKTIRAGPSLVAPAMASATHTATATAQMTQTVEPQGSMLVFKLLTLGLVLVAVGLTGFYFYDTYAGPKETFKPPENAPVPQAKNDLPPPLDSTPLWEQEIPQARRDTAAAANLERAGDQAHLAGNLGLAATKYQEAFEKNPDPVYALKLGEVYHQQGQRTKEARAWWGRHLKDSGDSRARAHIKQVFPDLE